MTNLTTKKRIDFVDLAKGICIMQVVLGHCGYPFLENISGFNIVSMPLFFILSGMFTTITSNWKDFIIKKINSILIPFLFFYLLGNICYYLIQAFIPNLLITGARGIFDLFNNRQFFNGPIWFLLCLFWCNVVFYSINIYVKKESIRIIIVCLLGTFGWYMGNVLHWFVPLFIDVAFTALPFFVFGYYLKRTSILYPNRYDKYNWLFALILWGVAFVLTKTTHFRLSFHYNGLEGWSTYVISVTSVLSILFLCKIIKRIPIVSYMGRYSIILLCTHHLIYRPVRVILNKMGCEGELQSIAVAAIALFLSTALIPLCIKYIPWFTAQKNLIKLPSKS